MRGMGQLHGFDLPWKSWSVLNGIRTNLETEMGTNRLNGLRLRKSNERTYIHENYSHTAHILLKTFDLQVWIDYTICSFLIFFMFVLYIFFLYVKYLQLYSIIREKVSWKCCCVVLSHKVIKKTCLPKVWVIKELNRFHFIWKHFISRILWNMFKN